MDIFLADSGSQFSSMQFKKYSQTRRVHLNLSSPNQNRRNHLILVAPEHQEMNRQVEVTFFFFFRVGLHDPIACSLLGSGIPSQNSGYKSTRLYPSFSLGFCYYVVAPLPFSCLSSVLVDYSSAPLHSTPLDPLNP